MEHYINAVVISLFATWFIPVTIRDAKTGELKGFFHQGFFALIGVLIVLQSYLVGQKYGVSTEAVLRVGFQVAIAMVGSLFFVKCTHEQLFGKKIKFTRWW